MQHGRWLRNTGDLSPADLVERAVGAEDPGEILVLDLPPDELPEYRSACGAHGVTWRLSMLDPVGVDAIRAGPPV